MQHLVPDPLHVAFNRDVLAGLQALAMQGAGMVDERLITFKNKSLLFEFVFLGCLRIEA